MKFFGEYEHFLLWAYLPLTVPSDPKAARVGRPLFSLKTCFVFTL